MKYIAFFAQVATPSVPLEDVNGILAWIIGVLVSFATGVLLYLRSEIKEKTEHLKNDLKEAKALYNKELEYSKEQDRENVKLLIDTGVILNNSIKKLENNSNVLRDNAEVLRNIRAIQDQIEKKLQEIKKHGNGS